MNDYAKVIGERAVRFERTLPGPIERVWQYLTESDLRGTWFATGAMEPRVGGKMTLNFQHQQLTDHGEKVPERHKAMEDGPITSGGTITVWDPPRPLAFVWEPDSEVSFELSPKGKDVLLVLTHSKLASRDEMVDVSGGWHAHLGVLLERLHGQRPAPFWPRLERYEREYAERIPR